ncbi:unnamed protein product [Rhizophagus irregularis]|nr:unnamed protein product [Rhizophagus irregularis]
MLTHFQFSDGFGSVKVVERGLVVGITFSIFLLWIEFILYLRYVDLHILYYNHYKKCISVHFIHDFANHCVRTHNVSLT